MLTADGPEPGTDAAQRVCADCFAFDPDKAKKGLEVLAGGPKDGYGNPTFSPGHNENGRVEGSMIRLEKCELDDDGITALIEDVLPHCRHTLSKVFLDTNHVTDAGSGRLREAIGSCPKLTKLQMRRNKLSDAEKSKELWKQAHAGARTPPLPQATAMLTRARVQNACRAHGPPAVRGADLEAPPNRMHLASIHHCVDTA